MNKNLVIQYSSFGRCRQAWKADANSIDRFHKEAAQKTAEKANTSQTCRQCLEKLFINKGLPEQNEVNASRSKTGIPIPQTHENKMPNAADEWKRVLPSSDVYFILTYPQRRAI